MHKPTLPGYSEVLHPADDNSTHPLIAEAQRKLNRALRGRVVVDYDTRTVVFKDIDGDHAMRLLALTDEYEAGNPASRRWSDQLDPRTADAGAGWISFRPDRVLSIRWFPERMLVVDDAHAKELDLAIKLLELVSAEPKTAPLDEPEDNTADDDEAIEESAEDEPLGPNAGDAETGGVDNPQTSDFPTARASPAPPPE